MGSRGPIRQGGFTLLEVLIAMVILGASLGVIFQLLAQSKRISLKSDETLAAVRIMNNLMEDPRLMADLADEGTLAGALSGDAFEGGRWRWRLTLETPVVIETDAAADGYETDDLSRVTLHLTRGEADLPPRGGGAPGVFTLSRWMAAEEMAGGAKR